MSVTLLEVLQSAKINLVDNANLGFAASVIGQEQLTNAIELFEAGYGLYDDFDESWTKYKEATDAT